MPITVSLEISGVQSVVTASGNQVKSRLGRARESVARFIIATNTERQRRGVDLNGKTWAPRKCSKEPGKQWNLEYAIRSEEISVGTTQVTAAYFHFGTKPHVIVPRTAKVLHWVDCNTGEDIFARKVNHPGQPPRSILGISSGDRRAIVGLVQNVIQGKYEGI